MKLLEGKTAIVTGAARGIGEAIALKFAENGANVAFTYVSDSSAEKAAALEEKLKGFGVKTIASKSNAGDFAACEVFVTDVLKEFGAVDICVNNAGISKDNLLLRMTPEQWDEVMDVNLKAPWFLSQKAARWWVAHPGESRLEGGFKLVFVSSVSAEMASMNRGDYCISKAGIGMMARVFALRLAAHGTQVVEFRPGIMETDMTAGVKEKYDPIISGGKVPMRRWGQPSDVGRAVRSFLMGDLPFCTGEAIYLDGGLHLPLL